MKKLFLVGALALFGAVNAQTEKGTWVVEGKTSLGFNNTSTKVSYQNLSNTEKVSTFNITPSVGYFVANNVAVGLEFDYTSISQDNNSLNKLSFLPNVTYYFPTQSVFRPYLGAGIGYGNVTNKINGTSNSQGGFAWGVKGGGVYMLNQVAGINLGLGYSQFTTSENSVDTTIGNLGVNVGFSLFLK